MGTTVTEARASPIRDCRKGGQGRQSVLPERDPAAAVAPERGVHRRDQ